MKVERDPSGITSLTMNDKNRNVFSRQFVEDFLAALSRVSEDGGTKVLVVKGREDVFCGGAEKQALLDLCDGKAAVIDLVICERLLESPFPVIAAMEGHGIGGGLAMALCCDVVIAARESRYGAVFMNMGFTPGMGCSVLLADLVGPFLASEMLYTGKRFRGSELAARATNINYIVPRKDVVAKAMDVAAQIAEKDIRSIGLLKHALSARKKKLLIEARLQEDLMHRISFSFPETRRNIDEQYPE